MILFAAEVGAVETATGASVVACVFAAITGLFGWLASRDRAATDAKAIRLEEKVTHLEASVEECRVDRDSLRQKIDNLHQLVLGRRSPGDGYQFK